MSPSPSAPSFSVLGILTLVGSVVAAAALGATAGVLSAKRASQAQTSVSAGADLEDDANSTPVRAAAKRPKRSADTTAVSGSDTTYRDATPAGDTRKRDRGRLTADERKRPAVSTKPGAELDEEQPTPAAPADDGAENGASDEELDASDTDEVPEQTTDEAPVDETTGGGSPDGETSGEDTTSGETTEDGTSGETPPDDGTGDGDTGGGETGRGRQAGGAGGAGGASTGDGGVAGTVSG